ncbi:hypothetical protein HHX47_DHR1001320 [Lentinula edodes]|nr:hypothetical protein HHX47_DHR1001320 [Lentinula edodes]
MSTTEYIIDPEIEYLNSEDYQYHTVNCWNCMSDSYSHCQHQLHRIHFHAEFHTQHSLTVALPHLCYIRGRIRCSSIIIRSGIHVPRTARHLLHASGCF